MSKNRPPANATTIDRIVWYVEHDQEERGEALARLADYLEACFACDLYFEDDV